jgi:Fic family protein
MRLLERLPDHPIVTISASMTPIDASQPTATRAVEVLTAAGILVESTGRKRDRSFTYNAYVDCLSEGTERR